MGSNLEKPVFDRRPRCQATTKSVTLGRLPHTSDRLPPESGGLGRDGASEGGPGCLPSHRFAGVLALAGGIPGAVGCFCPADWHFYVLWTTVSMFLPFVLSLSMHEPVVFFETVAGPSRSRPGPKGLRWPFGNHRQPFRRLDPRISAATSRVVPPLAVSNLAMEPATPCPARSGSQHGDPNSGECHDLGLHPRSATVHERSNRTRQQRLWPSFPVIEYLERFFSAPFPYPLNTLSLQTKHRRAV